MTVAVLAVQGAFIEHEMMLNQIGVECFEIRKKTDLERSFDGLILPGGESTVQGKLLKELDLFDPLKQKIEQGLPVLGTCAGLILLAKQLSNYKHSYFGTLPVVVKRNAYGRQLGSFCVEAEMKGTEISNGVYKTSKDGVRVLPITEVVTHNDFFDYGAKYKGEVEEITPARLSESTTQRVQKLTEAIYNILGAYGIIRVDYIITKEMEDGKEVEKINLLEVNTTPGMTKTSFIPQQVKAAGLDMTSILTDIIEDKLK